MDEITRGDFISGTLVAAGSTALPIMSQDQTLAADCDSVPGAGVKAAIMKTHRSVNGLV